MREQILNEIKRLAATANEKAPGKKAFERATGIREHQRSGVYWSRWSDAIVEAGLEKNVLQGRFNSADVLSKIVLACRHYGRVPSMAEMKLYRLQEQSFPSHGTVTGHFPTKAKLIRALIEHTSTNEAFKDVFAMLPLQVSEDAIARPASARSEGQVYLLKSGSHYKIGRSDELERRVKSISIALPEAVTLLHTIRTDDAPGIEAYWHRRFADQRANGEWFRLGLDDVAAFKRRKYQ